MLSKETSSTIFGVFGMTRLGIELRSPGPREVFLEEGYNRWWLIVWRGEKNTKKQLLHFLRSVSEAVEAGSIEYFPVLAVITNACLHVPKPSKEGVNQNFRHLILWLTEHSTLASVFGWFVLLRYQSEFWPRRDQSWRTQETLFNYPWFIHYYHL